MQNGLTIDVEEYFHPSEIQRTVGQESWESLPSRVDAQVQQILELLESKRTKATFFILGWVAERKPETIRRIAEAGHEIACHSYAHRLVYSMTPDEFREDTRRAIKAIEDSCGVRPKAYRAPSYSITQKCLWALEVLVEEGFTQDSSIYPIAHDRYGIPGYQRCPHMVSTASGQIHEIPIATVRLSGNNVAPVGGGGYLRLLPYRYTAAGIRRLNREEGSPACIYFHPWEKDRSQPRIGPGLISRRRTYTGVSGMSGKLSRLLTDFDFSMLSAVFGQGAEKANSPVS